MPTITPSRRRNLPSALIAMALLAGSSALAGTALPSGGNYVIGKGTIASSAAGTVINQTSNLGIINWNNFSVGAGGSVFFNNGNGATLNRVTGSASSQINGLLGASGSVFLINPNGIVIGANGHVVTNGSFIASTRDLENSTFLAGGARSFGGSSNGSVTNAGSIQSSYGDVVLIGQSVSNSGSISAAHGTAALAAGNSVVLQPVNGDQRIAIASGTGSVTNTGAVNAAAAELKAADGNVYSLAGSNGGIVRATGTQSVAGHIWLTSNGGNVQVTGTLAATNANGSGGAVTVRGNDIAVSGQVNASATTAGGAGGGVSIIAANTDTVTGAIHASGGIKGHGGTIETSGHYLSIDGSTVNAGTGGQWLLDPYDLLIGNSAIATLNTTLGAGTSVTLQTSAGSASSTPSGIGLTGTSSGHGDIIILPVKTNCTPGPCTPPPAITWSTSATLTLSAYRNIDFLGNVVITGAGTLSMTTGTGGGGGDYSFGAGNSISFGTTNHGAALSINGSPYTLVYNTAGLQAINSGLGGNYALAASLDATGVGSWTPLGTDGAGTVTNGGNGFAGTFAGLGNTISNLSISDAAINLVGLFGYSSGTIRDLTMSGGSVSGSVQVGDVAGYSTGTIANVSASGSVSGSNETGGLVGYMLSGTIANSLATGSVSGGDYTGGLVGLANSGTISASSAKTGTVSGGNYVGGLVGYNFATVAGGSAAGNVSGTDDIGGLVGLNGGSITGGASGTVTGHGAVGGLVGSNSSSIDHSIATGAVSASSGSGGGLVGANSGTVSNSSASGNVSGFGTIGGLVGYNYGTISKDYATGTITGGATLSGADGGLVGLNDGGSVSQSYATGNVNAGNSESIGGLVGYEIDHGSIEQSYSTGAVTGYDYVGGLVGGISQGGSNPTAIVSTVDQSYSTGTVTATAGAPAFVGGLVGYESDGSVTASYWNTNPATFYGALPAGFDSSVWKAFTARDPALSWQVVPLTYSVAGVTIAYGTLTTGELGAVTLTGVAPSDTGNVTGVITLYNASNVPVPVSLGLGVGTYTEEVTGLSGSAAGSYSIAASGNTNGTLQINQATLDVSAVALSKVYGSADPTLTYTYSNLCSCDSVAVFTGHLTRASGETVAGGPYLIGPGTLSAGPNYSISYTSANFTITPAPLSVTAFAQSKIYGAADPALTYSYHGLVNGDTSTVFSGALGRAAGANVGTYAITQNTLSAGSNYNVVYLGANFTIKQAPLTITANALSKAYGAADPVLTFTHSALAGGDTAAVFSGSLSRAAGSNVGTYAIAQGTLTAGGNYHVTYVGANFTITGAILDVTANALSKVYGAADPTLTYTYSLPGGGPTPVFTGSLSRASGSSVGNYAIALGTLSAGANYTIDFTSANFAITPAQLYVTANALSKTYGAADPIWTYTYHGLVNGDTASVFSGALTRAAGQNVGTYAVSKGTLAAGSNYAINFTGANFTINQATLSVSANALSKFYGTADPTLTYTYSGFVNGDTSALFTGALTRATGQSVGNYAILLGTLSAGINYSINFTGALFSIKPVPAGGPPGLWPPH